LDVKYYIYLGAGQVSSGIFVNLSLAHNTVTMYQIYKFCNVVVICIIEYVWMRTVYTAPVYVSLFVLVSGIMAASVANVSEETFSPLGLLWGMLGTISSAV